MRLNRLNVIRTYRRVEHVKFWGVPRSSQRYRSHKQNGDEKQRLVSLMYGLARKSQRCEWLAVEKQIRLL